MKLTPEQRNQLNKVVPLRDLGEMLGLDWSMRRSIYCPFHENSKTMAAKVYPETNSIYCFSEQRAFYPVDVMYELLGWDVPRMLEFAETYGGTQIKKEVFKRPKPFCTSGMSVEEIVRECDARLTCE